MNRLVIAALFLVLLGPSGITGCTSAKTVKHVDTQAAGHDGATRLIEATIAGKLTGEKASDNVTAEQLNATPAPVRNLLRRTIKLIYKSRKSWHYLRFTLGEGPDPSSLDLSSPPSLGTGSIPGLPVHPETPGGPR